eukprot:365641-Chlamydomonas_euryale.AAC.11
MVGQRGGVKVWTARLTSWVAGSAGRPAGWAKGAAGGKPMARTPTPAFSAWRPRVDRRSKGILIGKHAEGTRKYYMYTYRLQLSVPDRQSVWCEQRFDPCMPVGPSLLWSEDTISMVIALVIAALVTAALVIAALVIAMIAISWMSWMPWTKQSW